MNIPTRPDVNLVKLPVDDISKLGFKFVTSSKEDLEIYKNFSENYEPYSEMSEQDRIFLSTLITQNKPKLFYLR